ncbi:MAG: hypothetical protein COC15_02420 [Legionellales bacterium]|nr:MAG: hypothetical protein COC15_02420 [Legionellales bacterium]
MLNIKHSSLVRAVCPAREIWKQWLEPIGISKFYYARIYDSEEQVEICSHIEDELILHNLELRNYNCPFSQITDRENIFHMEKPNLYSFANSNVPYDISSKIRQVYIDHGNVELISIASKRDTSADIFVYYVNSNSYAADEIFAEYHTYLDGFMLYMKNSLHTDKLLSSIHAVRSKRIIYNVVDDYFKKSSKCNFDINNLLSVNRAYLDSDCSSQEYLTITEAKCFHNSIQGIIAKDSAVDLGISYRTVQKHLENIRIKWDMDTAVITSAKQQYLEVFLQ